MVHFSFKVSIKAIMIIIVLKNTFYRFSQARLFLLDFLNLRVNNYSFLSSNIRPVKPNLETYTQRRIQSNQVWSPFAVMGNS